MRYLSRVALDGLYVYNDEDDTEEYVDSLKFEEFSKKYDVKGLTWIGIIYESKPVIWGTDAKALKYSMLMGIDFNVNRSGVLKMLDVRSNGNKIVLSDICSSLDDFSMYGISADTTFVFDDSIKSIGDDAFRYLRGKFYTIDIRNVLDDELAYRVYNCCRSNSYNNGVACTTMSFRSKVLDKQERGYKMDAESVIMHFNRSVDNFTEDIDDYIISRHKSEILASIPDSDSVMLNPEIKLYDALTSYNELNSFIYGDVLSKVVKDFETITRRGLFTFSGNFKIAISYISSGGRDKDIQDKMRKFIFDCTKKLGVRITY